MKLDDPEPVMDHPLKQFDLQISQMLDWNKASRKGSSGPRNEYFLHDLT
jgi:hypothetical protein